MRALAVIAALLAAPPAPVQPPDRQPLVNITRGSPATPGGVALLTLAEASLARAASAAARGDVAVVDRELRAAPGDSGSGTFVRALAAIAANAALAARSGAMTPADAARLQDCAGGLADAAETASPSLDRLESGADANGDGAIGDGAAECGLGQFKRMAEQLAGAAGL